MLAALSVPALASPARDGRVGRDERALPAGFTPAILSMGQEGRYFVQMSAPAVLDLGRLGPRAQRGATVAALRSQTAAVRQVESLNGTVVFRYSRLVNAFSAQMSASAAAALAARPDVALVEPVPAVVADNASSVPFIGTPKVWNHLGARGQGITVAVVDTGVDYTHADFGGPGTVEAYDANDPTVIEPGTFPTTKVIGGYDFVGGNYSVIDDDPTNDLPVPDPDPLDDSVVGDHGTHVAGTCCGIGVPGIIGKGVAPKAKILAVKVWDDGNSSADVLVAGYEFAMDPNQDGNTNDHVDVLSFSGGVDYGPPSSVEAQAAQAVVDGGTVFVAAAGNSGNQPAGTQSGGYILGTPASVPGVIAVASSIDQFASQRLTVDDPSGVDLPDGGPVVAQDWAPAFDQAISGQVVDAREFDPPADPDGVPVPTDRILCDATPPGTPFAGEIALIFKGAFGAGDCFVEDKVIHAQEAGAIAVVLWDGFGGLPGNIGTGGNEGLVTIPAVDLSGSDSGVLAAVMSPGAPATYNTETVDVTISAEVAVIPGYADHTSTFSSEGPARISSALKPDVMAPGDSITSANAGTGDGALTIGGTSMATPHVSGVAALMVQLHPTWSPEKIKAVIMNQATQDVTNLDGSSPVPATVIGSGRVQAYESALAESLAYPGSLSYGLLGATDLTTSVQTFTLQNFADHPQRYTVSGDVRYTDFPDAFASVRIAVGDEQLAPSRTFTLGAHKKVQVHVEVTLDPTRVPKLFQEFGWVFFNGNVDGNVDIVERSPGGDELHVPWHVTPLAAAKTRVKPAALDLSGGSGQLEVTNHGAGINDADLYLLGAQDAVGDGQTGEGDLVAIGARSFTGPTVDHTPTGVPTGVDPLFGADWRSFLTSSDEPTEPVEFVAVGADLHNTTETTELDVRVDVGADGVFADTALRADVLIVKLRDGQTGHTCLFTLPSDFSACDAEYFQDYSNINSSIWGIAVDASALGLNNSTHELSYSITACEGVYAGDFAADQTCDTAGAIDSATGTYGPTLDVTDPSLTFSKLVVGGFWGGGAGPVTVDVGSAAAGDDPGILAVFPNNAPDNQWGVVTTST
jgi:subtilisin family serine protease